MRGFPTEIFLGLNKLCFRDNVKDWILPKEEGDWIINHLNPRKAGAPREIADWIEAHVLSEVIDQGTYNVKPMGNKKLDTLWLCWTPLTIDQGSPTLTPVKKGYGKKGKAIRKEIKQEIEQEVKSEPANTANQSASVLDLSQPSYLFGSVLA